MGGYDSRHDLGRLCLPQGVIRQPDPGFQTGSFVLKPKAVEAAVRKVWCVGLMRTQRNALFERVVARGLDPADFQLMDAVDGTTLVDHSPTRSTFSLVSKDGVAYRGRASIGDYGPYEYGPVLWDNILQDIFPRWVYNVKVEGDTPDMWEEVRSISAILADGSDQYDDNSLFSPEEREQISAQLRQIKRSLKENYSLSDEKLAGIEARLDEAEEASHRIGRKDWRLLFYGIILTLIVGGLVSPDIVQHIVLMAVHGLDNIFGGQGPNQLPPQT